MDPEQAVNKAGEEAMALASGRRPQKRGRPGSAEEDVADDDQEPRLRLVDESSRRQSAWQRNLANLWRAGSLCDVTVVVEGAAFRAHRAVLAAGSDYMAALLCEDRFEDSAKERIELGGGVDVEAFRLTLEWLYDCQCDVAESQLMGLLETAARLQCVDLLLQIEPRVMEHVEEDNCLSLWETADRLGLGKLSRECQSKAIEYYELLVPTKDFEALPASKLSALIASSHLDVLLEEDVFRSIVRWAEAQSTTPSSDDIGAIFEHVRFPIMSEDFINDHVNTNQLISKSPRAKAALAACMKEKAAGDKTPRTSRRLGGAKCFAAREHKPRRNQSAFFLYMNAHRAEIKARNPGAGFGDIAKLISIDFKALSGKERARWDKLAAKDKVRYQEAMKKFDAAQGYTYM